MFTTAELDEYLAEIRKQVCGKCVDRPTGGPPCAPLGKICGVEQHLPELIDAVPEVYSPLIGPYFESTQRHICQQCCYRHSSSCPCPMDYLLILIVEAIETVDARHERRRQARRRLAARDQMGVDEIRRRYREAKGTWTGCDWPTHFGKLGLDLEGWTPERARRQVAACGNEEEAGEWEAGPRWLAAVNAWPASFWLYLPPYPTTNSPTAPT